MLALLEMHFKSFHLFIDIIKKLSLQKNFGKYYDIILQKYECIVYYNLRIKNKNYNLSFGQLTEFLPIVVNLRYFVTCSNCVFILFSSNSTLYT